MPVTSHTHQGERMALLPDASRNGRQIPSRVTLDRAMLLRLLVLVFLTEFAYYHLLAPKLRLIELESCRDFYRDADPSVIVTQPYWPGYTIDEHICKVKQVQSRVSNIRSIAVFVEGLITVLLSIPYGHLADRYGRKVVYQLGIIGLALSNICFFVVCSFHDNLPIEGVIAASAFLAIGGGTAVLLALAATIGTDISPEEHRSTVLYWILATYYLSSVSASTLVVASMTGLLLPFILALLALSLAYMFTLDMQDTRRRNADEVGQQVEDESWRLRELSLQKVKDNARSAVSHGTRNWKLVLAVLLVPVMASRGPMIELALPYVSTRYDWSLREAATLDAINASISLLFSAIVLPAALRVLRYKIGSAFLADGVIAMCSAGAICAGAVVAGAANTIAWMILGWVIYSTGCGVRMAVISIATSLSPTTQFARLNTVIITVETIADLTLSPLIWQAWRAGLNAGGSLLGLPWFIVAATMAIVLIAEVPLIWFGEIPQDTAKIAQANGGT